MKLELKKILAHQRPLDKWHDFYQEHYLTSFKKNSSKSNIKFERIFTGRFPSIFSLVRDIRGSRYSSYIPEKLNRKFDLLEGNLKSPSGFFDPLVGQYVFSFNDSSSDSVQNIKISIDCNDSGEKISEELVKWSDVYLKTNFRPKNTYPENIKPFPNISPLCSRYKKYLTGLRSSKKIYDLSAILRIWGGTNNVDGIEHNIRLLEALNRVKCKNKLVMGVLVAGDKDGIRKRLESQGIKVVDRGLKLKEVWALGPQSKFSFQRLGVHYCMPWRFVESLLGGTAIVLDTNPKTVWQEPLVRGTHFESLDLSIDLDRPLATDQEYREITSKAEEFLAQDGLSESLALNGIEYFDKYLNQDVILNQIIKSISPLPFGN